MCWTQKSFIDDFLSHTAATQSIVSLFPPNAFYEFLKLFIELRDFLGNLSTVECIAIIEADTAKSSCL